MLRKVHYMRKLIFLLFIIQFYSLQAQKYEYVKRAYNSNNRNTTSGNSFNTFYNGSHIIYASQFLDDSTSYDTLVAKGAINKSKESYIICDTMGRIQKQILFTQCNTILSSVFPKNKDYFYTTLNASEYLYINGTKMLDSIGKANTGFRVIKCGFDGSVSVLHSIYAYANNLLYYDETKENLYVALSQILLVDSAKSYPTIINKNKVNVLQINTSVGGIEKVCVLDSVFNKFSIDNGKLLAYTNIIKSNYKYSVRDSNYYRNSTTDNYTTDAVVAGYDLNTSQYLWHHQYKVYTYGKIMAATTSNNNFCIAIDYIDTIAMDGVNTRIDSVLLSQKALINFDVDGGIKWLKTFNNFATSINIKNFGVWANSIRMELNCSFVNSLKYDKVYLAGYNVGLNNHVSVDLNTGKLLSIYPKYIGGAINFTDNEYIYYGTYAFQPNGVDTITFNKTLYKARKGVQDYIFYKYNKDANNVSSYVKETDKEKFCCQVFPNPSTDKLHVISNNNVNIEDVVLFDLFGKQLNMPLIRDDKNIVSIDMSGIQASIYILKVNENSYKIVHQ